MFRKRKSESPESTDGTSRARYTDELGEKLKDLNTPDASDVDAFEHEKEKKRAQRAQYDADLTDGMARPQNNTAGDW